MPCRWILIAFTLCTLPCNVPAWAAGCRAMESSAVGVETGTDLLPQRCDTPGKCRIFDMAGRQIGAVGDYALAGTSSEGLVAVHAAETDLQGYMDAAGTWVVPPKFRRAGPFCEGRAAVQVVGNRWFYIDRNGNQIGDTWDGAEAFTEGRGMVSVFKGGDTWLHGFVDATGRLVIPARFPAARLFSEGRAAVRVDSDKWGYIDRDGTVVIAPRFGEAELFHAGRAVIRTNQGWAKNSGLIDESGKLVIAARYEQIIRVGDADLWRAGSANSQRQGKDEPPILSRIYDRDGRLVSNQVFEHVGWFSEGLIDVCRAGKCGFIDVKGKPAVPLQFKYVDNFEEGLAAVTPNGDTYGFIDRAGKFVIPASFDSLGPNKDHFSAGPFVDGMAPAGCQGHWGFIDKQGAWTIAPVYLFARAFANGFAEVQIKTGTGHVRPDGTAIDFGPDEVDVVNLPERPCGAPLAKPAAK